MKLGKYLQDKVFVILINILCVLLVSLYLFSVGNNAATIIILVVVWVLLFFGFLLYEYSKRKKYFSEMLSTLENLEKPYLIQEVLLEPQNQSDAIYKEVLIKANKAALEMINTKATEQKEYREYIEQWIHEVKTPITQMRLFCNNRAFENKLEFENMLTIVDNDIEQVLFCARSMQVYKDFIVREQQLDKIVSQLLKKNKYLLIQNNIAVQVELENVIVYTDEKWVEFILGQILINAVKYKKEKGEVRFSADEDEKGVTLFVRDNGMGISQQDISRVFEKGFTGTNGRQREKSTGIGLYLCNKLCNKLEIGLSIQSAEGEYTELALFFPKNDFLTKL